MGRRLQNPKFQIGEEVVCDKWMFGGCQKGIVQNYERYFKRIDDKGNFYHETEFMFPESELYWKKTVEYVGKDIIQFLAPIGLVRVKHHNYIYKVRCVSAYSGKEFINNYFQQNLTKLVVWEAEQVAKRLIKAK